MRRTKCSIISLLVYFFVSKHLVSLFKSGDDVMFVIREECNVSQGNRAGCIVSPMKDYMDYFK